MTAETAFRRFRSRVVSWARLFGAPEEDAEDVAQNVFRAFEKQAKNIPDEAVKTWLWTTTKNKTMRLRRALQRYGRVVVPSPGDAEAPEPSPERTFGAREVEAILRGFIMTLEPKRRAVFVRAVLNGETLEEVAISLGISLTKAKSRLRLARGDLRKTIHRAREEERRRSRGSTSYGILPLLLFLEKHRAAFLGAMVSIGVAAAGVGVVLYGRATLDEGPPVVMAARNEAHDFLPIFSFAEAPRELEAALAVHGDHRSREAGVGELPERTLLALARRALADGSPSRAREYLERAARAYPAGSLAPERKILHARANAR